MDGMASLMSSGQNHYPMIPSPLVCCEAGIVGDRPRRQGHTTHTLKAAQRERGHSVLPFFCWSFHSRKRTFVVRLGNR